MNIARHMELTLMQAGKKNLKSSRLQSIFGRSDNITKYFGETHEQLGMNESPVSVRNYPQCEKKLQCSRQNGFLEQRRVSRGILYLQE
jgi:hypothetical protein